MDKIILEFCNFLSNDVLNISICGLGIVELVILIITVISLSNSKKDFAKLDSPKRVTGAAVKTGKNHVKTVLTAEHDWEQYIEDLSNYNKRISLYTVYSLIIQLFPLLGILGTVAGLFMAINGNDFENLSSIAFALSSTVLGLIWTILYKVADAILVSFVINPVEDIIETFEKKYDKELEEARSNSH